MPIYLRWFVILVLAAALACCFHPGRKGKYFFTQQMFVSFSMFAEALSLVSQLYHMHISKGLEGLNSKYLMALGISRVSRIYFWYTMSAKLMTFWYLIGADSVHTIMVVSFIALYRHTRKSESSDGVLGGRRIDRDD